MKFKSERVKNLLKREILKMLVRQEINDPRVPTILTITKITLSKDLRYSHIYFSITGSDDEKRNAEIGLNSASGLIQKIIGNNLQLKYTPILEFRYDYNEDKALKVDQLLDKLRQKQK